MKLFVGKNNINHRSKTVNRGDVIEEDDRNHYGALVAAGCQPYDPDKHDALIERIKGAAKPAEPAPKPEPAPEPEPSPAPKKKSAKKKGKA